MVPFELQRAGPARGEEEVRALGCVVGVGVDGLVVERHRGRELPVCHCEHTVTFEPGIFGRASFTLASCSSTFHADALEGVANADALSGSASALFYDKALS